MSEDDQRSTMIVSMEKTLNSAWFNRRGTAHKNFCSLSTGQYWDWLTYIDVSRHLSWRISDFNFTILYRMTT